MDEMVQGRDLLRDLLSSQIQAVLATQGQHQPYTSLMAFAATDDLKTLLFATYRNTHKYQNLKFNPHVAMLIDNRTGDINDHYRSVAVTATGRVREVDSIDIESCRQLYLSKHPNLEEFILTPACALMEMRVLHYYIVSQFQQVVELVP